MEVRVSAQPEEWSEILDGELKEKALAGHLFEC